MKLVDSTMGNPFGEVARITWANKDFVAGLFCFQGYDRLSIARADSSPAPMSWEELQAVKSACGFGNIDAVEVYPKDRDVVNTGNVRHLYLFRTPLAFAMRAQPGKDAPFLQEVA